MKSNKISKKDILQAYEMLSMSLLNYNACVGYKELEYNLISIKKYGMELINIVNSDNLNYYAKKEVLRCERLIDKSTQIIDMSIYRIKQLKKEVN